MSARVMWSPAFQRLNVEGAEPKDATLPGLSGSSLSEQPEVRRSERIFTAVSLAPLRLGMLSEEAVPRANSVLEALAKHLEVKLAFGATGSQMKATMKAWMPINML